MLVVVEKDDPPMKASSVDGASSRDFYMRASAKGEKVLIKFLHFRQFGPFVNVFGCDESACELDGDVVHVLDADRHGVEFVGGDADCAIGSGRVGTEDSCEDGLGVFELVRESVRVGHCTK